MLEDDTGTSVHRENASLWDSVAQMEMEDTEETRRLE